MQTDYDGAGLQEKVGRYAGGVLKPYAEAGRVCAARSDQDVETGLGRGRGTDGGDVGHLIPRGCNP